MFLHLPINDAQDVFLIVYLDMNIKALNAKRFINSSIISISYFFETNKIEFIVLILHH